MVWPANCSKTHCTACWWCLTTLWLCCGAASPIVRRRLDRPPMPFTSPPITMVRTAWSPPSCGTPTSRNLRDELPQLSAKTFITNHIRIRTLLVQARDEFSAVPHHDPAEELVRRTRRGEEPPCFWCRRTPGEETRNASRSSGKA